jgi:hypothetical protein
MADRCAAIAGAAKNDRTVALLGKFRRLAVRYERSLPMYRALCCFS